MKRNKIIFILAAVVLSLTSCGGQTSSFDFNQTYYKVLYNFESVDGDYVLDPNKTIYKTANAGDEITIIPENFEGYTCVSDPSTFTQVIPEAGSVTFSLDYRSDYSVEVVNKLIKYYDPKGVFNFVGDTIKISRVDLPDIGLVLNNENTKIVGEVPDVSRSGEVTLVTTWANKEYIYDYSYFTGEADINDVLDLLKVDAYEVIPEYIYNFKVDLKKEKDDLNELYNDDIAEAKSNLYENIKKHDGNKEAIAKDKEKFLNACAPTYKKYVREELEDILIDIYSRLNVGVLKDDALYLQCGYEHNRTQLESEIHKSTYVYKDPTYVTGDNRWWIPAAYKPYNVLQYANQMNDIEPTFNAVKTKYEELLIDVIKCGYLAITEALTYYYSVKNNQLTIEKPDEKPTVTPIWWNIWSYAGVSDYSYDGHIIFDPTTVGEFAMAKSVFNKNDAEYKGSTLSDTLDIVNYIILYCIDREITHQSI